MENFEYAHELAIKIVHELLYGRICAKLSYRKDSYTLEG